MPRAARKALGGQVYHVLNRSVGKRHLVGKDADFEAFQRVMIEAHQWHPIRILSDCVLSNHWQFAVGPDTDGQVTVFFRWLAHTSEFRERIPGANSGANSGVRSEFRRQSIFSRGGRPRRRGSRTMPRRWEMTSTQSSAP
jgi:putative transposase